MAPMFDNDLLAAWQVLETEIGERTDVIEATPSGVEVNAGEIMIGLDSEFNRHVLIPLMTGESFAEDRTGRSIHVLEIPYGERRFLSTVCLRRDLDGIFVQFARELVQSVVDVPSPASETIHVLERWRSLFHDASSPEMLPEKEMIGLLGELLVLSEILRSDSSRNLNVWTGPLGSPHDFRKGRVAIEVKATLVRDGRIVPISSVDQLHAPEGGSLHVVHHRFEPDSEGYELPEVVNSIIDLGVVASELLSLLERVGYRHADLDLYRGHNYKLVDRRIYNVEEETFPKLTSSSFISSTLPPGVLHLRYAIDLTNEPPWPLSEVAERAVIEGLAGPA